MRATLLLILGPDLIFTLDVARPPFEEDELLEFEELDDDEEEPEFDEEPEDPLELEDDELPEPDETLRYSPQTQPVFPLALTWYHPPRCSSTVTEVPAERTRATRPLILGPERMFTPEVTLPLDEELELDEDPDEDEPEELLAVEGLLELEEEPEEEPEEPTRRKSSHTQPVFPLTRT